MACPLREERKQVREVVNMNKSVSAGAAMPMRWMRSVGISTSYPISRFCVIK
jgi:hypothetical protein